MCISENVAPPADLPLPDLPVDALRGLVLLPHPELATAETTVEFTDHTWVSEWVMPTSRPVEPDAADPVDCSAPPELWRAARATAQVDDRSFGVNLRYSVPHDRSREPTLLFYETDVVQFGFEPALQAWWAGRRPSGGFESGTLGASVGEENRWAASLWFGGGDGDASASTSFEGETVPLPASP